MSEKERILNKILNDKSRPVEFKDSYGGSENQLRLLFKNVDDEYFKDVNLILNSTDPQLLEKNKKVMVVWSRGGYTPLFNGLKSLLRKIIPRTIPKPGESKERNQTFSKRRRQTSPLESSNELPMNGALHTL